MEIKFIPESKIKEITIHNITEIHCNYSTPSIIKEDIPSGYAAFESDIDNYPTTEDLNSWIYYWLCI